MAQYLDRDDDTTKLIIFGIGLAAIGFIAIILYRGSCQQTMSPPQYLAPSPVLAYQPQDKSMYSELHAMEHRLEKLESKEQGTTKLDLLEQKLLSLENKIDELVKSTVQLNLNQEQPERNIVSMSDTQPTSPTNVRLSPAEHHTLMRNYFQMQ